MDQPAWERGLELLFISLSQGAFTIGEKGDIEVPVSKVVNGLTTLGVPLAAEHKFALGRDLDVNG